jgi:hypothetical protein
VSEGEGSWWPFAVPAVIVAALVTTVFVVEDGAKKTKALTCPAIYRTSNTRPWVPDVNDPVDKNDHIAPVRLPTDVVICKYGLEHNAARTKPLTGSRQLHGSFQSLVDTVAYLPRTATSVTRCSAVLGAHDDYLLGLTYTDGSEWISASDNVCLVAPTTNGTYDSPALHALKLHIAYKTRSWPGADKNQPCTTTSLGRSGQETKLVPDGVDSADICQERGTTHVSHAHLGTSDAGRVADRLNQLATSHATRPDAGCFGNYDVGPGITYVVVFHYGVGADAIVDIETSKDCSPAIGNGSLESSERVAAVKIVEDALAGH